MNSFTFEYIRLYDTCVCMRTCMYVYVFVCTVTYVNVYICVYVCICVHVCVCVCVCVCTSVCTHVCPWLCNPSEEYSSCNSIVIVEITRSYTLLYILLVNVTILLIQLPMGSAVQQMVMKC